MEIAYVRFYYRKLSFDIYLSALPVQMDEYMKLKQLKGKAW